MTLRKLAIVPMLALVMFATGCGDDCESVCEARNGCADVEREEDCSKACEDDAREAEDADCEDQYDEVVSCVSDQDDVCDEAKLGEACRSEFTAFNECMNR
jgi:hypothetical protein